MFRKISLISLAAIVLVVAVGCEGQTDPATNVTATSATLNGKGRCTSAGERGDFWWELGRSGVFQRTGARNPYNCGGVTQTVPLSANATGLMPSETYQFRLCNDSVHPDSPVLCVDANGTVFNPASPPSNLVRRYATGPSTAG